MFHENIVSLFLASSAVRFPTKNATTFPAPCAAKCRIKSASTSHATTASACRASTARTCPTSSARPCRRRRARKNARMPTGARCATDAGWCAQDKPKVVHLYLNCADVVHLYEKYAHVLHLYVKYSPLIERFPRIGSKCPKILYIKMMEDKLEINVLAVILVHIVFVHQGNV